jgi:uncharacterized membrane protein YcaP (DUF421 family)
VADLDFFQSHESLSILEWVYRAVVGFVFLVVVAKLLGQRTLSQLRLLDFVIALVIGNIIAHPLSDQRIGMKESMVTTAVLVVLYLIGIYMVLNIHWFRKLITPLPIEIIKNGEIHYQGLKKARITLDILLEELREKKVDDIKKVALAIWEANGQISIFLDPQYEPATAAACQIETDPFELPRTIIKEGKIVSKGLSEMQKDEAWLRTELEQVYQTEVKNVLLATIDSKENLKVFYYK